MWFALPSLRLSTSMVTNMVTESHRRRALQIEHLTVSYGPRPALLDVSLSIDRGQLVGIIGPNGAGKSTFVKALLGFVTPDFGTVRLLDEAPGTVGTRVAYVPQRGMVDWDFPVSVRDVVLMGRYGHMPWWRSPGPADHAAVDDALAAVAMSSYANRQIGQLSGGQQQRVFLARALAQGAELLLLDEPLAGVDVKTEETIITVLRRLRDQGCTLLVVHHDLGTAATYFDRLVLLKQRVVAYGPPATVLQEHLFTEIYEGKLSRFGDEVADG